MPSNLKLTTRGRRTGTLRRKTLYYGRDGDRLLVVASNGGAPDHPSWYLNLVADPAVTVEVGREEFAAQARPASPTERRRLWQVMVSIFPMYARFQAKTDREIPVVIIERMRAGTTDDEEHA
ncbi:MAG: nitroreductase/quinone reductase family protein [Jiangellaceae bacterium]